MEADEAVQSCVSPKIAAQGSKNALARYRGEEASHRLTRRDGIDQARHDFARFRFSTTDRARTDCARE